MPCFYQKSNLVLVQFEFEATVWREKWISLCDTRWLRIGNKHRLPVIFTFNFKSNIEFSHIYSYNQKQVKSYTKVGEYRVEEIGSCLAQIAKYIYLISNTALRLLGSFQRVILKAEWSPNILSRGCENFFPHLTSLQNNKTI